MDICDRNTAHPPKMTRRAFAHWIQVARYARYAKGQLNASKIFSGPEEDWNSLRAYYLKVKDLQMQSSEDSEEDWEFLAEYKGGAGKLNPRP